MKKAIDYGNLIPAQELSQMQRADIAERISAELRKAGVPHSPAKYDEAGNCLTCGCSWACPGVHTFEEIQEAARKESETTRHTVTGWPAYSPSKSALKDLKHMIETQKGNTP